MEKKHNTSLKDNEDGTFSLIFDASKFQLTPVTIEEISVYRKKHIPSLILRKNNKFFYTEIPSDTNLTTSNLLGAHQCATGANTCDRLLAASDEKGGCKKVRNHCRFMEKYPWILEGYETFDTCHDCFVVITCEHYRKSPPRKNYTSLEIYNKKLALFQYMWPDSDT